MSLLLVAFYVVAFPFRVRAVKRHRHEAAAVACLVFAAIFAVAVVLGVMHPVAILTAACELVAFGFTRASIAEHRRMEATES